MRLVESTNISHLPAGKGRAADPPTGWQVHDLRGTVMFALKFVKWLPIAIGRRISTSACYSSFSSSFAFFFSYFLIPAVPLAGKS